MIVGAGIGGLAAALDLAASGRAVIVLERAGQPGGKLRAVDVGGSRIDAGPTVVTMRGVFDRLMQAAGTSLDREVGLIPLDILARHHWPDGTRLDLHAQVPDSIAAIEVAMGQRAARDYAGFCRRSETVYRMLDTSFMTNPDPGLLGVTRHAGFGGVGLLRHASPFSSMWDVLGHCFADPRLRQLFARYATYSGASPFAAPATLMLIAHAEQAGVWRIEGGMERLATALADVAARRGAVFRYGATVREIVIENGRARFVRLDDGTRIEAAAVISNAELGAMAGGGLGDATRRATGAPPARSLSAITWQVLARPEGFPLSHHNVFFSTDYAAEFRAIARGAVPRDPTIYLCAQDRDGVTDAPPSGPERMLILVNAPATGDSFQPDAAAMDTCFRTVIQRLAQAGLSLAIDAIETCGPVQFETRFPGAGGALYGRDLAGWRDPFQRPRARTSLPGLYFAGGSTHPGPGLPMAALSGRFASRAVQEDER